ncbi:hypothetical protein GGI20_000902 [Coemansia sp. BCRC 34301]|nr:hypothetical protein GGI20_000902 [Coemansia sp. BCRC 34301]
MGKHKMRLAVRQRPKTLHSRIRDILPSLSAFKMFAWEELLFKVRNGDNVDDHASAVLAAAATSLSKLARSMSVFLAAWLSADSSLDSIRAISSLQLTAASCAELVSSVGVIAGIWQLETVLQTKLAVWPRPAPASSAEPTISIQNAAFKRAGQADVALRVDSLSASSDQIIGVSGSVGSGKSTLLLAVARELETVSGTVFVSGTMAFVSQSPWLMSGTIRANILFGRPFNDALYSKTTHVCCLDDDIARMALVGMVLFAVPTILYQRQVSSAHNPQEPRRDLLIWVAMDVLSVWLALVAKETVYVDLARSWIQPVLLDSLAHAQMAEIWRTGDAQLVSVVRCTERATTLGVHVFVVDSIVAIANLVFVAYSTLRLSYAALAVSVLASVGVVFYRMQKGSSALLPIQRYRRRIQVDMDRTAHDMFSGLQVVRIHGVYRVFEDQLRRLDGWQQAAGALANAVLFTKYLWQHVVDAALSLGLVGVMLMTDVGVWRLTPATVQLYYETTSKLLTLLSQLANIQANASNHALVWQELCDMSSTVPEAPWHIAKDQWAGKDASSHIKFTGCGLRYRQGDQLALRGVSFSISAGERVGIVGRTGSGKSSLVYALLRVVELESGAISLGGMDISKLGLHDLRQSISVVPQTAALLEGTVRSNIDPFEEHTDAEIDVAIEACQLGDIGADKKIESGGRNLSAGQQQLVSICRAVLRRRKILVLDEATANVDEHTQQIISAVIKQEFKHSTVLIIAHRLEATAGCSRILVMDSGRLVEQGSPAVLATRSGHYAKLLRAANSNI